MTSHHYKVVVVIVTYNGSRWVNSCFTSLRKSTYPVEVIVVDNNSTDNTVSLIRGQFPEVELITNNYNAGFGEANNQAMRVGIQNKADYFFLLNQDAWIEPDTIANLISAFAGKVEYGVVSPLHYNGSGDSLDAAFRGYVEKRYSIKEVLNNKESRVYDTEFINAAAWMISSDCLEKVGGFGYLFHQYGEDRDFIQRLKFYGLKTGFITTTKIFHDRPSKRFQFNSTEEVVWYYTIGTRVRLADVNTSFLSAFISVLAWLVKDITALLFKGKLFSLVAFGKIFFEVFVGSTKEILSYRKKIGAHSKFLFLAETK